MQTIESSVAQIKQIYITIESILESKVAQIELMFDFYHNGVDSEHNGVASGDAHNTVLDRQFGNKLPTIL